MPTNKLWIEHTERAAWESVDALREKLADAEKRLQRMAPPVDGWQNVVEALERAARQHALPGSTYAEWLTSLLERLDGAETRIRSLEDELSRARESGLVVQTMPPLPPPVEPVETKREPALRYLDDDDFEPAPSESRSRALSRFFTAMQRRYRAQVRDGSRSDIDALIQAIETKVDELSDLDEPDLAETAVDLAVLAMRLERESKRRA